MSCYILRKRERMSSKCMGGAIKDNPKKL